MPAIDRIAVDLKFNRILRSLRQTSPPDSLESHRDLRPESSPAAPTGPRMMVRQRVPVVMAESPLSPPLPAKTGLYSPPVRAGLEASPMAGIDSGRQVAAATCRMRPVLAAKAFRRSSLPTKLPPQLWATILFRFPPTSTVEVL
jgi:hypothetical protein